jgi:hypothetical protein
MYNFGNYSDFNDSSEISDELLSDLSKNINSWIESVDKDDYIPNQTQQLKFLMLLRFLEKKAQEIGDAEVKPVEIIPQEMCAGIDANFLWFSLNGEDEVEKFNTLLSYCSAFSVCPTNDERTRLSFTIPNLYSKKIN